jgi:hypothetical protein
MIRMENNENASRSAPFCKWENLYSLREHKSSYFTRAFFSESNLKKVHESVDNQMTKSAGMLIGMRQDIEAFNMAAEIVCLVPNYAPHLINWALEIVNTKVVNTIVKDHLIAFRRRKLFLKYFVYEDKAEFLPRPEMTWGRRRINRPSSSQYFLGDPYGKRNNNFISCLDRLNGQPDNQTPDMFLKFLN